MELNYKDGNLIVSSDKKEIILSENSVNLDGLNIDIPGEYEKSGFLMYVRESENTLYFYFRVEGNWLAYIPAIPQNIDSKILDFLGNLDILIAPFSKLQQKFLEQIEPRMLASYSENASDLVSVLGEAIYTGNSYKLKSADISPEKTSLVILQK